MSPLASVWVPDAVVYFAPADWAAVLSAFWIAATTVLVIVLWASPTPIDTATPPPPIPIAPATATEPALAVISEVSDADRRSA